MFAFGVTSTKSAIFPPGAAVTPAGEAAMMACFDSGLPLNWSAGADCAATMTEPQRTQTAPRSVSPLRIPRAPRFAAAWMFMPAILALLHLVDRPGAAAKPRTDQRAFLAAEDRAEPRAGRGRAADDHRGFRPVAS